LDIQAKEKWNKIYSQTNVENQSVSRVLLDNAYLLPQKGRALDLACGAGADAIYLANHGLDVDAWDISDTVIGKLSAYAKENALSIHADARDINLSAPQKNHYDVICVAHFLERELVPVLVDSLAADGLLVYQTFSQEVTPDYTGPRNPAFRLEKNELLDLFSDLQLVVYREEGLLGDLTQGFRNEVMYIGQKH